MKNSGCSLARPSPNATQQARTQNSRDCAAFRITYVHARVQMLMSLTTVFRLLSSIWIDRSCKARMFSEGGNAMLGIAQQGWVVKAIDFFTWVVSFSCLCSVVSLGASTSGALSMSWMKVLSFGKWKRLSEVTVTCLTFSEYVCVVESTSEMKCLPRFRC